MKQKIIVTTNTTDINNITLETGFINFIRAKKAKNLSPKSIEDYIQVFGYFTKLVPVYTPCNQISDTCFIDFIEERKKQNPNISSKTIETYMRHLRAIFYFFMEKGYMSVYKIEMPRYDVQQKDPFTDDEVKALVRKPNLENIKFPDFRNWVLACFLLGSGVRQNTIINIRIENLDFQNKFIRLTTVKNRKSYNIPMSQELSKILQEYLVIRGGEPQDFLFCNQYGEQMSKNAIKTAILRYSKKRGVSKNGTHVYRHTFAKYFVLGGGTLEQLQEVLGHSDIEMARHYVKLYGKDLQKNFEQKNPLDVNRDYIQEKPKRLIKM